MKFTLKPVAHTREIYHFMQAISFPYRYEADFSTWENSYLHDTDGEGRTLFSQLATIGAYAESKLIGFVQYGTTAFGFDENGGISIAVSYSVIRNFYCINEDAANALLTHAVSVLSKNSPNRIYAFFHYFGMSCYARHGKLHEGISIIEKMLLQNGFCVEHENVFYSSTLTGSSISPITLNWHVKTAGNQQYCDFILDGFIVGGCEVHFLPQGNIAYLRWIFVNGELCGKGISTQCMAALKSHLYSIGVTRFYTDTAMTNKIAQRFYEKTGFRNEGATKSYYLTLN